MNRIRRVHVACFKYTVQPLFLISEQYPGLWLEHVYDSVMLAQEIDPVTGVPTKSSQWYSGGMLCYVYAARRLGLI